MIGVRNKKLLLCGVDENLAGEKKFRGRLFFKLEGQCQAVPGQRVFFTIVGKRADDERVKLRAMSLA